MNRMFIPSDNLYVEALPSNVIEFGGEAFWKSWWRHEGGASWMRLAPLKDLPPLCSPPVRTQEGGLLHTKERGLRSNQTCRHFRFGLWTSRTVRDQFLLLQPPRLVLCYDSPSNTSMGTTFILVDITILPGSAPMEKVSHWPAASWPRWPSPHLSTYILAALIIQRWFFGTNITFSACFCADCFSGFWRSYCDPFEANLDETKNYTYLEVSRMWFIVGRVRRPLWRSLKTLTKQIHFRSHFSYLEAETRLDWGWQSSGMTSFNQFWVAAWY